MGDFSEVLYFAIFYNDNVIIEELRKLGRHYQGGHYDTRFDG